MTDFSVVEVQRLPPIGFLQAERRIVECPDGERVERIAITHPGAVAIVPIDGDEVVLIRQYRAALDQWLLEIPAGKRDVLGELPTETAVRELREELGITGCSLHDGVSFYNAAGYCDEQIDVLIARDLVFGSGPEPDGPEERFAVIERLAISEISEAIASGRIQDAKTIIGLQLIS